MTTVVDTPRFSCRVTRQWLAVFGSDDAIARNSHVAGCADCQAFFSAGDELDQLLRREAVAQRVAPSPMLEQKILHAVHRSTAPARRSYTAPLFTLVGAAAAIAMAFVVLRPAPRTDPQTQATPSISLENEKKDFARLLQLVPTELFTEMRPQAEAILRQDPMGDELNAIQDNARTAVRFLAKNFLVGNAQESLANNRG